MIAGVSFQILWTILVFLTVFNFFPVCLAVVTRHPQRRLIGLLNILSLFSIALWLALMVWVMGGERNDTIIGRFVNDPRYAEYFKLGISGIIAFGMGAAFGQFGIV